MTTGPDRERSVPDGAEPDLVLEDGLWVMTRAALLRRGSCCGLGCRNCPYVGTAAEHPDRAHRRGQGARGAGGGAGGAPV